MIAHKVSPRGPRRKPDLTRFPFALTYRRQFWSLGTSTRVRRFAALDDVRAFVARVSRRRGSRGGPVLASLEEYGPDGRWRTVPLDILGVA